ncbi:MAG TPA: pilus assembly protein PilM [Candidatus Paceibacterota bacterium]|jgi:Tfp pilus assembly PilM family ATPase|nr:pilus assembly protein PilM [Candidatus Paceibacterota bacterium]
MHSSIFFKLFPPPKFLLMPHVGIDISDDAITFVEYSRPVGERWITKFGTVALPANVIDGGDIKDEQKLKQVLGDLVNEHDIKYAKISIPEEKAYLFEIEVPYGDFRTISQSIEFKLEENIPLSAADAVFAFDILTNGVGKPWRASVSAVPRTYIEHVTELFRSSGIIPISFETTPRAVARVVSSSEEGDVIVVHTMSHKTGIYIVSQHAVGFTSTIASGFAETDSNLYADSLAAEIGRVNTYWNTKGDNGFSSLKKVLVIGHGAEQVAGILQTKVGGILPVEVIDIWHSILNTTKYVPPILKEDSFEYAAAAGLAL